MTIHESSLTQIRLHARHTGEPLTADYLEYAEEEFRVSEAEARIAYQEGLDARASGMRCLCGNCGAQDIVLKERLRTKYVLMREEELKRQGMSQTQASKIIEEEVARGAALKGKYHDETK